MAGMSFRWARSPLAPKMTRAQGGAEGMADSSLCGASTDQPVGAGQDTGRGAGSTNGCDSDGVMVQMNATRRRGGAEEDGEEGFWIGILRGCACEKRIGRLARGEPAYWFVYLCARDPPRHALDEAELIYDTTP